MIPCPSDARYSVNQGQCFYMIPCPSDARYSVNQGQWIYDSLSLCCQIQCKPGTMFLYDFLPLWCQIQCKPGTMFLYDSLPLWCQIQYSVSQGQCFYDSLFLWSQILTRDKTFYIWFSVALRPYSRNNGNIYQGQRCHGLMVICPLVSDINHAGTIVSWCICLFAARCNQGQWFHGSFSSVAWYKPGTTVWWLSVLCYQI